MPVWSEDVFGVIASDITISFESAVSGKDWLFVSGIPRIENTRFNLLVNDCMVCDCLSICVLSDDTTFCNSVHLSQFLAAGGLLVFLMLTDEDDDGVPVDARTNTVLWLLANCGLLVFTAVATFLTISVFDFAACLRPSLFPGDSDNLLAFQL